MYIQYYNMSQMIHHWETQGMELSGLEDILMKDLHILSFPLSLIIREYVYIHTWAMY